jgi:hypothetical protein
MNILDKEKLEYYIDCNNIFLEQNKNHRNIPIIIFGNNINNKTEFEIEQMLKKQQKYIHLY